MGEKHRLMTPAHDLNTARMRRGSLPVWGSALGFVSESGNTGAFIKSFTFKFDLKISVWLLWLLWKGVYCMLGFQCTSSYCKISYCSDTNVLVDHKECFLVHQNRFYTVIKSEPESLSSSSSWASSSSELSSVDVLSEQTHAHSYHIRPVPLRKKHWHKSLNILNIGAFTLSFWVWPVFIM